MRSKAWQRDNVEVPSSGSIPSKSERGPRPRASYTPPERGAAVKADRGLAGKREHAAAGHPGSLDAEFFSAEQVATILNVCERTVRRWIDSGKLIAHDFEGIIRISDNDLQGFVARRRRL